MILLYHKYLFLVIFLVNYSLLTKAQDIVKQDNFDVKFYWLDLKVSDTSTYLEGKARVDVEILKQTDSLALNMGHQLLVSKVTVDGVNSNYFHEKDILYVLSDKFQSYKKISIEVYYEGNGNDSLNDGAMFKGNNNYGPVVYTLAEPFATKYWFPCKEVLSDKADSVYIYLTVPRGQKAGSNGILKKTTEIDEGHLQFQWESKYPVSYYLISMAVADFYDYTFYVDLNDTIKGMPVVNYIYNNEQYLADNKSSIDATGDMLIAFSELFGVYPFYKEKYGHCLTTLGGGMEHQTMTTLGGFGFDLVSHELAHQWFGDYVTCKYWNDIWINEGFASYGEYLAREKIKGRQSAEDWMVYTQALVLAKNDGSVYVPEVEVGTSKRIFDNILSYKKGASIIHMIRFELGSDTLFFDFLKLFLERYKFNTASGEDLKSVLEDISGRSFEDFFNEWYYGQGYPIIQYGWYQNNDTLFVTTNQTTSAPDITPFFHIKLQFKLVLPIGDTIVEGRMGEKGQVFKFYMPSPVYSIVVDPNNFLLKKTQELGASDSSEAKLRPLLFFPNPAGDEINLFSRSIYKPVDLLVYNIDGTHIKTYTNVNPLGSTIKLTDFDRGVYMFKVSSGSTSAMYKIIKH
jgi:aminopeptidase N